MDESYLRCSYLCFKCLKFLHEKITTALIIVYCFAESYLRRFYLCFKCLKFLYKKIILITDCPDNLNIYTTKAPFLWVPYLSISFGVLV